MTTVHRHEHALVIGASMAGLLAARVLADDFARVTLIERDTLPAAAIPRRGVPQGRHVHGLLAGGQAALEGLFPGLVGDLVAGGATSVDITGDVRWYRLGGYCEPFASGLNGLMLSRALLEHGVRRRVRALPQVAVIDGCDVTGLVVTDDRARVTGVTIRRRGADAVETLAADLVVDAGGRGSRAPAWLAALGYRRPVEERIAIGVAYTSRFYRRRPGDLPGAKFAVIQPTPPRETRMGALFPVEGERWLVSLAGWLGDHASPDDAGFLAFARDLPAPDIHAVITAAEPLGEADVHRFPANLRRRYERLARVPEGYVATGDALCSFNPVYGQGMTVAALEALALAACVRAGRGELAGLPRRFYRRAARVIDTPWQLAAGADFAYPAVTGKKAPGTALLNRYVRGVFRAAMRDAQVSRTLAEVTNLLAAPSALFAPGIVWRVTRAARGRSPRARGLVVDRLP